MCILKEKKKSLFHLPGGTGTAGFFPFPIKQKKKGEAKAV